MWGEAAWGDRVLPALVRLVVPVGPVDARHLPAGGLAQYRRAAPVRVRGVDGDRAGERRLLNFRGQRLEFRALDVEHRAVVRCLPAPEKIDLGVAFRLAWSRVVDRDIEHAKELPSTDVDRPPRRA